ncbi:DivIVA domain-containing protein [Stackebrandtia albiflava]|uniref:Cell wall synthesis protein Wag31 n=1 Tax=Stackebrandtia albiflava TaxID=406432 RepID=A0A562V266_9ACTN|nr:DivIVA domain-containing protein [Stackebrandtia albiflava]TWJ11912.1 DivIVA domain-containing protein [Stackebrandtia albiflava]
MTMSDRAYEGAPVENRMTAIQVSRVRFNRSALGRRGYDQDEVDGFLSDVARELSRRFELETSLRAEADNYKRALRDWQSRTNDRRQAETMRNMDPDAINLLSQAQQQAEGYVTQAQDYCRQIIGQARGQAREVLQMAREQAEVEAERAAEAYRLQAGGQRDSQQEDQARQLARAKAFMTAINAAEEQLRMARMQLDADIADLHAQGVEVTAD